MAIMKLNNPNVCMHNTGVFSTSSPFVMQLSIKINKYWIYIEAYTGLDYFPQKQQRRMF